MKVYPNVDGGNIGAYNNSGGMYMKEHYHHGNLKKS